LLFRKFAIDFAEKYRMPELELEPSAVHYIENYAFPGNIRQLRNLVEQMTVVKETEILQPKNWLSIFQWKPTCRWW
jgi:DNA-binding NtrC family response regulator